MICSAPGPLSPRAVTTPGPVRIGAPGPFWFCGTAATIRASTSDLMAAPLRILACAALLLGGAVPAQTRTFAVDVVSDERYSEASRNPRRNRLDLYLPAGIPEKPPLVMFVHGGSWIGGNKGRHHRLGERLAARGIACAAINYRLSPFAKFPEHAEDCAAAFAWLRANADRHGFDRDAMFAMGHSAGGHLCALLALDRDLQKKFGLEPSMIRGVVGLSGVYDVRPAHRLLDGVFGKDPKVRAAASPIVHATGEAPPFFLRWGSADLDGLPQSARALADRLGALGVSVDAAEMPGVGHTGYVYRIGHASDPIGPALFEFLRQQPARASK